MEVDDVTHIDTVVETIYGGRLLLGKAIKREPRKRPFSQRSETTRNISHPVTVSTIGL